jgi:hypothetical protein
MDLTNRNKGFNRYGILDALNQVLEGNMLKEQSLSKDLKWDLN